MPVNALTLANGKPYAVANLKGNYKYNNLKGTVQFFPWSTGTIIKLEVVGLTVNSENNFFGFHIHETGECIDSMDNPYLSAGGHFNKNNNKHPNHTGDLPMIYSNNGYAFMLYYTARFKPVDVINKSVIIHKMADDLMTDPAGNSGERIACGVILRNRNLM